MLDPNLVRNILAQVAGSYLAREMDRRWIDDLLDNTPVGAHLRRLTPVQVRGMELVMYTVVAYVSQSSTNPSALRIVLQTVLTDLPIELVKRLMAANGGTPKDLRAMLDAMSDEELLSLHREITRRMRPSAMSGASPQLVPFAENSEDPRTPRGENTEPPASDQTTPHRPTAVRDAADNIAAWRKSLRARYLDNS